MELQELIKETNSSGAFEVTITMQYLLPSYAPEDLEKLAKEWFVDYLTSSHAFKDNCKIGHSEKLIEVKIYDKNGDKIN